VDTTCEVRLEDAAGDAVALDDTIRDELIALEHAAAHVNSGATARLGLRALSGVPLVDHREDRDERKRADDYG
jgi:hypothetical protein